MYNEDRVLCGANSYEKKFYINDKFKSLPEQVKQELQIMCVMFTEEVGGTLVLEFDEDGYLQLITDAGEDDLLYDEIGSGLKIHQIQLEKRELDGHSVCQCVRKTGYVLHHRRSKRTSGACGWRMGRGCAAGSENHRGLRKPRECLDHYPSASGSCGSL